MAEFFLELRLIHYLLLLFISFISHFFECLFEHVGGACLVANSARRITLSGNDGNINCGITEAVGTYGGLIANGR